MGWLRVADICSTFDGIQLRTGVRRSGVWDHWTGALLLERTLVVLASGFNCVHFLRELWRLRQLAGGGTTRGRAMRAAVVAMVVINASLLVGALHPLAAARFAAVGRSPGLEVVAVGVSLTAALFMTALVMRERK